MSWLEDSNRELELYTDGFKICYTTTGQDPRMFGNNVHPATHPYERPWTATDDDRVLCRILEGGEWETSSGN
ncbi:MAG: hypothetical protein QGG39_16755 [Candidatus Poribacteria bacterium]|nr:hypothetical protein [Candidatus Poribacteria bacterium]